MIKPCIQCINLYQTKRFIIPTGQVNNAEIAAHLEVSGPISTGSPPSSDKKLDDCGEPFSKSVGFNGPGVLNNQDT